MGCGVQTNPHKVCHLRMKQIYLSGKYGSVIGNYALVDDIDYEIVNKIKWYCAKDNNNFYAISNKGKHTKMHRLILGLTAPNILADHIDHNGLNNQKCNLRICSHSENMRNRKSCQNSTSKYLGVNWEKRRYYKNGVRKDYPGWKASLKFNKKNVFIGMFKDEKDAALAYNKKATELFGEFANLNIIQIVAQNSQKCGSLI